MLNEALKIFGVHEVAGTGNNPVIMQWATELGGEVARDYTCDLEPWCGLTMAIIAQRAGKVVPANPLWALNWVNFGHPVAIPMLGDILIFKRITAEGKVAGHVSMYIGETNTTFFILGGNQSDQVCIEEISKSRLYAARRPNYIVQPANVRRLFLTTSGKLATNEA